jgi:hypothetical protein
MEYGIKNAEKVGRPYEMRSLGEDWEKDFLLRCNEHSQREIWELSCKKFE